MVMLILGVLASLMGTVSFALWATNTSASNNLFSTGTVSMSNSAGGTAFVTLTNMVPGDSATGIVTVNNSGSEDLTAYQLTTAANPSSALDKDAANGLKAWVERCSVAWTVPAGGAAAATCAGAQSNVVGSSAAYVPVIMSGRSLAAGAFCSNSAAASGQRAARKLICTVTGSDHLRVHVLLAPTAPSTYQGLTDTISVTFSGTQPAGTAF
ncbi:MAG: TasA family protein [Candidatus Dormibacterales bacterium]